MMEDEVLAAAYGLFVERGYGATTPEAIARAAGISLRTFYRYFAGKDDVLVRYSDRITDQWREAIASRPPEEAPLEAIRQGTLALARLMADEADRRGALLSGLDREVVLAHSAVSNGRAQGVLTLLLAERLGVDPDTDMRPAILAAAAVCAVSVALEHAARSNGDRAEHVERALGLLAHLDEELPERPSMKAAPERPTRQG